MKFSTASLTGFLVAATTTMSDVSAFSPYPGNKFVPNASGISTTAIFDGDGTGGWGIGGQRKITEEEYARGDRRYFDGYKMSEQGDFMMQIEQEKDELDASAMKELLGVASFAGINVKKSSKFDDSVLLDDNEDLDLSI